jgi:hypothetical protein
MKEKGVQTKQEVEKEDVESEKEDLEEQLEEQEEALAMCKANCHKCVHRYECVVNKDKEVSKKAKE